ncbi:MAG TPA: YhjD/YihY/BrkB family envelope integrity protein [Solirubrobacteraceae bacterium]
MTRPRTLIDLTRNSITRFVEMDGIDRSMGLAAQGFTALFPLLIVIAAGVEGGRGASLGDALVRRFHLSGGAAAAAHRAFPQSGAVGDSVTVVSALVLLISVLSFARALQRMYERAWRLEARGIRDTPYGLLWLAVLCAYAGLHLALNGRLPHGLALGASIAESFVLFLVTPYIVLGRRLPWRLLVPQAVFTAAALTALRGWSALYMPRAVSSAAQQFGTIGFAFAMVSWLFTAALALVATAAVGACVAERMAGRYSSSVSPGVRTRTSTPGASSAA